MTRKRRENAEIIAEILEVCIDGASKTRIVTQTNLNFRTAEPHIALLIKKGLLEAIPHRTRLWYRTSPKGKKILEKMKEIWGLFGSPA